MGFGFERSPQAPSSLGFSRRFGIVVAFVLGLLGIQSYHTYTLSRDIPANIGDLLHQAGYRAAMLDVDLSTLALYVSNVVTSFQNTQNADIYSTQISQLLEYVDSLSVSTSRIEIINSYISLFDGVYDFKNDILSLLGFETPQTYIIVLQNTSEVRPNGGFFGSFALLTLDTGRVSKFEIVDSYHPARENPDLHIQGPERLLEFLPHRDIHFIGANKIGYTYHDGAHIQQLYERAYPRQPIRGVVFVSTDMISRILPDFAQAQRERQFVNASSDLIRGGGFGKKELYLNQSSDYIQSHSKELALGLLKHLPDLISRRYIHMYLDDISVSGGEQGGGMTQRLRDKYLTTRYEDDHLYVWGSNISYNKIDTFITKTTTITDGLGNELLISYDDQIDLERLLGDDIYTDLTIDILYRLDIPDSYREYIWGLESEYGIEMTDRERHILGLTPSRATRALLYLPAGYRAVSVDGRAREVKMFETPFAHAVSFETDIQADGGESRVVIELKQ